MKIVRDLKRLGEELGLTYVSLEDGSNHYRLMFSNKDGYEYGITLHKSKNEPGGYRVKAYRQQLKSFAEGKYHMLKVRKVA